jgi:putative hemolysin
MSLAYGLTMFALLAILSLAAYIDRVYYEMGKFLSREYQDNIDSWEELVEPKLTMGREFVALSVSVMRQASLATVALLFGARLYTQPVQPHLSEFLLTAFELILLILVFDRLIPQILFARTEGRWIVRLRYMVQMLIYGLLPVTIVLSLLLSIAALAEPEDTSVEDHPSEAMDALLEAGEEEGILEESDRQLVRSVVEFGDKVVREIMTPRPEVFAVASTLTLEQFTAEIHEHIYSRVPVYRGTLDEVTGIIFAHDLLQISDTEAATRTVAQLQRPAAFVPETKMVAELLREMQREKQHMRIVIDEYGQVAGIVTIEDLIEAIVGSIADEHDEPEDDDAPVREADGAYIVSGTFELSRLRELFADQFASRPAEAADSEADADSDEPNAIRLPEHYESSTLGGLVSEIAGHIPLPGEVVEEEGLRLEVLASTERRIDRIRVSLATPAA